MEAFLRQAEEPSPAAVDLLFTTPWIHNNSEHCQETTPSATLSPRTVTAHRLAFSHKNGKVCPRPSFSSAFLCSRHGQEVITQKTGHWGWCCPHPLARLAHCTGLGPGLCLRAGRCPRPWAPEQSPYPPMGLKFSILHYVVLITVLNFR